MRSTTGRYVKRKMPDQSTPHHFVSTSHLSPGGSRSYEAKGREGIPRRDRQVLATGSRGKGRLPRGAYIRDTFLFRNTVTNKGRRIKAECSNCSLFIAVFPQRTLAPLSHPSFCCPFVGLVTFTMKSYIFAIISAALFVAGVSAQLTVNTP